MFVNPGTAALGLASAVELAKKGAHVIITARSAARGEQVLKDVTQQVGALGGGGPGENFISSFNEGTGTIEFGVCQVLVCACMHQCACAFLVVHERIHTMGRSQLSANICAVSTNILHHNSRKNKHTHTPAHKHTHTHTCA